MDSAYLYLRVSTDEQRRKGFSLPEQEDRLLKYCAFYGIEVKGIFREDFSAKNFNRPEWKRLVATIKKSPPGEKNNILFLKWDRFSRNIEHAYEMIGILRRHNTTAMAIDQPIDFSVPESTVMLAVYLSIPEAENTRKALNVASTIRKAKELGRYPNKAPLGFINLSTLDGKKYIAPKEPEASILAWAFQQLTKHSHSIEEVRRMAVAKGLKCSKSNFWRLLRNPVYCGFVSLPLENEGRQLIKAVHEPLVPEALFWEVQNIIGTKRMIVGKTDQLKSTFILKGYLDCPACGKKLSGSFSSGRTKRYPYYHCSAHCGMRVRAEIVNSSYNEKLQQLALSDSSAELFALVLEDANAGIQKTRYLQDRQRLLRQVEEQESLISKARKLLVADKLKFDDFRELKREYLEISCTLQKELGTIAIQLACVDRQYRRVKRSFMEIFSDFEMLALVDKKLIVAAISPVCLNIQTGQVSLQLSDVISKILSPKNQGLFLLQGKQPAQKTDISITGTRNFIDRKISIKKAVSILAKNKVQIDDSEAVIILDFLYHIANTYKWPENDNKRR